MLTGPFYALYGLFPCLLGRSVAWLSAARSCAILCVVRLPNGERAIVEESKLRGYVLNPQHPVGRHHARLFNEWLGIHQGNLDILRTALVSAASKEPVTREVATPYGTKFEMRVEVLGPRGARSVRAVWIVERGGDRPRLVTCFVE